MYLCTYICAHTWAEMDGILKLLDYRHSHFYFFEILKTNLGHLFVQLVFFPICLGGNSYYQFYLKTLLHSERFKL